jgi:hypothetical protein
MRHEVSRPFRNKQKEYLKAKLDEPETNSKIKNIRYLCTGIIEFKKDFQPRTDIVKDEKRDFVTVLQYFVQVEKPPLLATGLKMLGK